MLASLTSADFTPLVGRTVTITPQGGPAIPMTVDRVVESGAPASARRRRAFAVLMLTGLEAGFESATCTIAGDGLETLTAAVNRVISDDPGKACYQIAFN